MYVSINMVHIVFVNIKRTHDLWWTNYLLVHMLMYFWTQSSSPLCIELLDENWKHLLFLAIPFYISCKYNILLWLNGVPSSCLEVYQQAIAQLIIFVCLSGSKRLKHRICSGLCNNDAQKCRPEKLRCIMKNMLQTKNDLVSYGTRSQETG